MRRHGPLLEIHYRPLAGVRTELEALIAVEAQACPFLSWALDHDFIAGQLVVQIKASPQHPDHVDAIALVAAA